MHFTRDAIAATPRCYGRRMPPRTFRPFLSACLLASALHGVAAHAADPAWLPQAQALERRADWSGLLALARRLTQDEAGNALAWFVLGRAYGALGRYPEAIAAYRENLRLDPGDWYAHNNLGNAYRATQRHREAMDAYHGAVRARPDYLLAWRNLGQTFYQMKGPAGVSQALARLRASDPALAEAWRVLAVEYAVSRDEGVATKAMQVLRGLSDAERERMFAILLAQP